MLDSYFESTVSVKLVSVKLTVNVDVFAHYDLSIDICSAALVVSIHAYLGCALCCRIRVWLVLYTVLLFLELVLFDSGVDRGVELFFPFEFAVS